MAEAKTPIAHNIRIIRSLFNETQEIFAMRFTEINENKQQSYELASAKPGALYMEELSELTGIVVKDLIKDKIATNKIKDAVKAVKAKETDKTKNPDKGSSTDRMNNPEIPAEEKGLDTKPAGNQQPTSLEETLRVQALVILELTRKIPNYSEPR